MAKITEPQPIPEPAEVALVEREPELVACDECIFQDVQDSSVFFCLGKMPSVQRPDGTAQWPRINREGMPKFKGCGEGRKKGKA